jgi:hypothetical protein
MVELLEKSSPLIVDEVRRWRYLLLDEYIEHQQSKDSVKELEYR